jgi:RNA polymerase sigma-70 factor, ECF subfamily
MESMNQRDQEAIFRRWIDDHLGLVLKVVRAHAASPADRDDLFQDILVQLWSSVPAFRGDAKETTWIYRVAFNTALTWQRGQRHYRKGHVSLLALDGLSQTQKPCSGAGGNQGLIDRLYAAIQQLPGVDASLILMHLDGLSYREIADVLGISENHVGVKLTRVRKQLAELLKGADDEL